MKQWTDTLKNLSILTQFGLSLITPLLLCLAGCWWLNSRFQFGIWIYAVGFFLGLGGSGTVAYKLYLVTVEHSKKEKKKVSFNRHV